ncbi:hypothetical protein ACOBQX_20655 [Actinokineospora sp. G85]|uniref:hypothetical protein n=1 Tax=Actinokineospora sp. G85 TaxID=3406626 RepID=UPI003C74FED8
MYIDEGDFTSLGAIGASMDAFAASAAAGQFAVNQQGGDALLAAIRELAAWIDGQRFSLRSLEQEPQLGSSNAAKVMKPYVLQVAIDHQGFLTQLFALYDSLVKAEQAIMKAMENYRQVDEDSANNLA